MVNTNSQTCMLRKVNRCLCIGLIISCAILKGFVVRLPCKFVDYM